MSRPDDSMGHLSLEEFQDWVDGRLHPTETARFEAHVAACARCTSELEAWRAFMADLSALDVLAPTSDFQARVLGSLERADPVVAPAPRSLAARARALLAPRPRHPDAGTLQEFGLGALARGPAEAVRRHVDACETCGREARAWERLGAALDGLPRLAPSPGFTDAVLRRVAHAPVPSRAAARTVAARSPRRAWSHRTWAAAAGVAVAPVVTAAMVAWAVFRQPLATVTNLAAFFQLRGASLVDGAGTSLGDAFGGADTWLRTGAGLLAASPTTAGATLLALGALTMASGWVVYRNVIAPPTPVARAHR